MDHASFDRIARLLGQAATRRTGIAAAAAAAVGLGAEAAGAKPGKAGPCGDGGRKANACTDNSDCCTGICEVAAGKKNKDQQGRCRCRRRGAPCTENKNCCTRRGQALVCNAGVCGDACLPLQSPCVTGDTCCVGTCAQPPDLEAQGRVYVQVCCIANGSSGCVNDSDCCQNLGATICNGGTCLGAPSDARLKEEIVPLDGNLAAVEALRPVRWAWTAASGMGERPQIGFIAQEVGQAVPEAVVGIGDGYLGIDYAKLVAVLTGAVQEQQAEIASLRARLAALESTRDGYTQA